MMNFPKRRHGFTLIELLVVIVVIAILISLLFPAFNSVRETARKAAAHSDLVTLVSATRAYNADYGNYPLNPINMSASVWDQTVYGDPNGLYSSADLCNVLRAIPDSRYNQNNALNPRGVVFLDAHPAQNINNPRSGLTTKSVTGPAGQVIPVGAWVDPWGAEYVVFIDAMNAGNLNQSLGWFYYINTPVVMSGVAASSLGKDGAWGTKGDGKFAGSDDVATWQ